VLAFGEELDLKAEAFLEDLRLSHSATAGVRLANPISLPLAGPEHLGEPVLAEADALTFPQLKQTHLRMRLSVSRNPA
jgi:hypothetical protein